MADMATFGARLRSARRARGVTQKELAEMIGAKHNSVSNWENDQNRPDPDTIEAICGALGISASYLLPSPRGDGQALPHPDLLPIETRRIPLLGEIAAGQPIIAERDYESYVEADSPIKADYALRVAGDSMSPTYLNGDIVYIRTQPDVDDGQIAAVVVDDSATLKHVYHTRDGVTLISDNPRYAPMHFDATNSDGIWILGLAVGYTRMY